MQIDKEERDIYKIRFIIFMFCKAYFDDSWTKFFVIYITFIKIFFILFNFILFNFFQYFILHR